MDDALRQTPPVDDLIEAAKEVRIRQELALVALGKRPADKALRVGRLFDVHTRSWREDWEIVIKGRRIAWVGPAGEYAGEVGERVHEPDLSAVPGFGEVHKHIESSHLTPEWEAALVLPLGQFVLGILAIVFGAAGRRRGENGVGPIIAGGVTTAVLAKLAARGDIDPEERVVLVITGEGLKTLDAVRGSFETHTIEPTVAAFDAGVPQTISV